MYARQWRSHCRSRGAEKNHFAKNWEKEGENQEGNNREKKGKIGQVLSLCPSWQIGLATLNWCIHVRDVHGPENNPNYVNFFFTRMNIQLQIRVHPWDFYWCLIIISFKYTRYTWSWKTTLIRPTWFFLWG